MEKLAFPLNTFMEQTVAALNGNLDFNNLNQEIIQLDIIVDAGGIPTVLTKFKSNLVTKIAGLICINAENITSLGTYPTNQPFISFAQNGNLITINHISGLQASNRYRLRLISIGYNIS